MARRALLVVCTLVMACRERPTPPEPIADASPADTTVAVVADTAVEEDTFAQAVAELEDASSDVAPLPVDVTIVSVDVKPKGALGPTMDLLARERWRFRACARFVEDAGTAPTTLIIRVGEGGEPLGATAPSGALGECLAKAGRALAFPEPDGGLATATVTLRWTRRGTK